MANRLFIDDLRDPPGNGIWTVVRTSAAAIEHLESEGCPSLISFDHDLGGDDTAMAVVHFLIGQDLDEPGFIPPMFDFVVHSANPIGAENIEKTLRRYLEHRAEEAARRP
ncbi:MAG: cyclic-phosphate processing receiver domain-containing protein [Rhodospirillales bacterium]